MQVGTSVEFNAGVISRCSDPYARATIAHMQGLIVFTRPLAETSDVLATIEWNDGKISIAPTHMLAEVIAMTEATLYETTALQATAKEVPAAEQEEASPALHSNVSDYAIYECRECSCGWLALHSVKVPANAPPPTIANC